MTKKVLYISANAAHDNVAEAGGKTFNYYIKRLANEQNISIKIICLEGRSNSNDYRIMQQEMGKEKIEVILKSLPLIFSAFKRLYYGNNINYWSSFISQHYSQIDFISRLYYQKELHVLKRQGWVPDIVVLEWPEMINLFKTIKRYFENTAIYLSDVDVMFQRFERKIQSQNLFLRYITTKIYDRFRNYEVKAIEKIDKVIVQSKKDCKLLCRNGVQQNKILVISPYFTIYNDELKKIKENKIVFWGAMNRPENIEAVTWFIDNVFKEIYNKDKSYQLIVIGNARTEIKEKLNSIEGVMATGFVESPLPYFRNAICSVAPLIRGAGIKVKVLESMGAGLCVLTNPIGIEGIDAVHEKSFFLCNTAEDYRKYIMLLSENKLLLEEVRQNASLYIAENFSYAHDFEKYKALFI